MAADAPLGPSLGLELESPIATENNFFTVRTPAKSPARARARSGGQLFHDPLERERELQKKAQYNAELRAQVQSQQRARLASPAARRTPPPHRAPSPLPRAGLDRSTCSPSCSPPATTTSADDDPAWMLRADDRYCSWCGTTDY